METRLPLDADPSCLSLFALQNPEAKGGASFDTRPVDYHKYQFVKAYLNNVFRHEISSPSFHVIRLLGVDSAEGFNLRRLTTSTPPDGQRPFVVDRQIQGTVLYLGQSYEIMVNRFKEQYTNRVVHTVAALGLNDESKKPDSLIRFLLREAMQYSPLRNHFLSVKPPEERGQVHVDVEIKEIENTRLDEVFLSPPVVESLNVFIECVNRYSEVKQPMRYLLNGKPGVGKTKIIRAIANEVKGNATFILTNGSDERVDGVFELSECFCPVVVCIDDVDLLIGNRDRDSHREPLAKFLQRLDGFIGSGVFVIATTNDKKLVDMAASRPGRFDLILDINPLDSNRYMDLIATKTDSSTVISLFTREVLDMLEARKASGAFIATLVKQLEVIDKLGLRELDEAYVLQAIDNMKKGFYDEPTAANAKFGFMG